MYNPAYNVAEVKTQMRVPVILAFLSMLAAPQIGQQKPALSTAKRIHVGSMGQSDEAERFRLLLADELARSGFDIVDDANSADAVLTGSLAVRVQAEKLSARVTVVLKSPDGVRLWGDDFGPTLGIRGGRDPVKHRAQDVAKALRKVVDEAARGARRGSQ